MLGTCRKRERGGTYAIPDRCHTLGRPPWPVNGISPAVSPSFRAMSPCDNCRIKSTHYCVTIFRGGPARYYGRSAEPRNGGPTRCRAVDVVLPKDPLLGQALRFRINGNKRRAAPGRRKKRREEKPRENDATRRSSGFPSVAFPARRIIWECLSRDSVLLAFYHLHVMCVRLSVSFEQQDSSFPPLRDP